MVYKLSESLTGHTQDVRAVASPTPSLVLSTSRDTHAIAWIRSGSSPNFYPEAPFHAGSHFVNAVTYLHSTPDAPSGSLVAGGQDTLINVFPIGQDKSEPTHTLVGHSENVCALDATPSGTIISGSWDKTARVWKDFKSVHELKGHIQAVWAVIALDDNQYLTGSADKTIRHWIQHKSMRTFSGHKDAVRSLVVIADIGFASCSNDSEIRVWTLEGDTVYTLSGHTSFVYSLALLPTGDIVSSGEDRSVRVWKDGECSQVIVHPAISVWAVSTMPNGDIVSGSSDGIVRIFSEAEERWANAEDLKAYEDEVSKQSLPSQQIGDVKKSDLPGPEALATPGKKEGQVQMVKTIGGSVEAHQWTSGSWQKIGEVVDAVGQGRKQLYEGKEYDYVFDVDIQDGVPPLKLPYNASENPYQAAQRFLHANELPDSYVDQVVQFIEKNTAGVQLGGGAANTYVDPYTGASRYQAGTGSAAVASTAQVYQDPFTGAGGYHGTPAPPSSSSGAGATYQDPFTGASSYRSGSTPAPTISTSTKSTSNAILPVRTSMPFKLANVAAMQTKLFSLSNTFAGDPATTAYALSPNEKASINQVFTAINEASPDPTSTKLVTLSENDIVHVLQVASRWPESSRFPVIDLARLISGFAPAAAGTPTTGPLFVRSLLSSSGWSADTPWPSPLPKLLDTNILLSLRAIANLFQLQDDKNVVGIGAWNQELFVDLSKPSYDSLAKNHWVALGTIVLNFSCLIVQDVSRGIIPEVLQLIGKILTNNGADPEGQYRALVALGNITYAANKRRDILDLAALDGATPLSTHVAGKEGRFRVIAAEIAQLAAEGKTK